MLNVLVVNDDGIDARGIKMLAKALSKVAHVRMIAPDKGCSAKSHAININHDFKLTKVDMEGIEAYSLNSTPADCTRIGLGIFKDTDIVFSGMNEGLNIAIDVIYSGTIAAAREAVIEGVPGVAISCDYGDLDRCEGYLEKLVNDILEKKLYSKEYVTSINFPYVSAKEIKGYKKAFLGKKAYLGSFVLKKDGSCHIEGEHPIDYEIEGSDITYEKEGYITFTPIIIDLTDFNALKEIKL